MMKFILMLLMMNLMLVKNSSMIIMFNYNILYISSFMMIFMYMYKDSLWVNLSLGLGLDYYSIMLVILSFWIIALMYKCLDGVNIMKSMIFMSLLILLIMFFTSMDLLVFYLMFEISLIPTFFLIIYWGSNPERLIAAFYMMIYMLLISFPLLLYIFKFYLYSWTFKFSLMSIYMMDYNFGIWEFVMINMAFFIKMPIYILHIWLPKAHVEAPVYGSMILAGVLLKMGSYGLIRFMELLVCSMNYNYLIFSVSIIGSVIMGMNCLVQIDMKSLVAYSSVVHMNLMLCSLLTLFKMGFMSSYIMMISHGLCSSGLFYMVNMYYSRSMSRLLVLNKGMMSKLPGLSMWWFLFCSANFSFPFSLNFFSELMMLSLILNWDYILMFYLVMICFFSSAYSLYLFSYVQHGSSYSENNFSSGLIKEYMVLINHFFPLIVYLLNLVMFV